MEEEKKDLDTELGEEVEPEEVKEEGEPTNTPEEGEETPEKPQKDSSEELVKKNKQLYARTMKAEEKAKAAELKLEEKGKPEVPADVFDLAKTVSALKEYEPEELDFIQMMAKAKDISPQEAAQSEEAKLYIAAKRVKVAKEKQIPEPSTKVSPSKKPIEKITADEIDEMSLKEKEEYFIARGMMKKSEE